MHQQIQNSEKKVWSRTAEKEAEKRGLWNDEWQGTEQWYSMRIAVPGASECWEHF